MRDAEEEVPKWQYQREKYPKQDVIRDVQLFGSLKHQRFASALTAVSLLHHTESARTADIIRVLKLSRRKLKLLFGDRKKENVLKAEVDFFFLCFLFFYSFVVDFSYNLCYTIHWVCVEIRNNGVDKMALPVVAIVGRPNVGKSTLFNKLIGQRLSIVEDTPGVTRDRIYGKCEWLSHGFMLVDTGGIEPDSNDVILEQMRRQAEVAIASADAIIFVTDMKSGVTASDQEVAHMLLKSGKPVVLCVNKCDSLGEPPAEFYEFYNLGLGEPFAVSSVHGHGTGDMLDEVLKYLPEEKTDDEDDDVIKVAVIGKPNVGKSSIINRICGEDRVIVSNIAGTTRDATDSVVENENGKFIFIDTAGIRRKSKVLDSIEKFSVLRAYMAVDRADVAVIVIDATVGFTEQDSKVAGYAHEKGKACVVAVNKWDAVEKETNTMNEFIKDLDNDFSFMSYVPYVFISAKTGQRMDTLFEKIKYVAEQNAVRIPTGRLNEVLSYATSRVQPPSDKGRRLKIYYMTQASTKPPTFVYFVNRADLFHFSYQRYLENQIREVFSLDGTPIVFKIRERDRNDVK